MPLVSRFLSFLIVSYFNLPFSIAQVALHCHSWTHSEDVMLYIGVMFVALLDVSQDLGVTQT